MFQRFSEKAINVILFAQKESRRLGHDFVDTEQILLGLIVEDTGVAAQTLKSLGVNLIEARIEVEIVIGRKLESVGTEIPFTPRAKRVLELAVTETDQLGDKEIDTEHLLLGLVSEGGGLGVRVLEKFGVSFSQVYSEVMHIRKGRGFFQPFSEKAIKVILLAQEESQRTGHNFVGSEQIFLGLIAEDTGIAAQALKSLGINLKDARVKVEKIVGRGLGGRIAKEIPFTPRAKEVLELALEEAKRSGSQKVCTKHLLLVLLGLANDHPEGIEVKIFEKMGVHPTEIFSEIMHVEFY